MNQCAVKQNHPKSNDYTRTRMNPYRTELIDAQPYVSTQNRTIQCKSEWIDAHQNKSIYSRMNQCKARWVGAQPHESMQNHMRQRKAAVFNVVGDCYNNHLPAPRRRTHPPLYASFRAEQIYRSTQLLNDIKSMSWNYKRKITRNMVSW